MKVYTITFLVLRNVLDKIFTELLHENYFTTMRLD